MKTEIPSSSSTQSLIDREFAFTPADFERVRNLIYRQAGIALTPVKQDMVYSRLARRLRATGCQSFEQYLDLVEAGGKQETQAFVNALTTNLTSFFREPHHFEILQERLRTLGRGRPVKIWCAAASTGEEAYSLAITACEAFDSLTPPVRIIASDIDTSVLETGRQGLYPRERIGGLSLERLNRFFHQVGGDNNHAGSVRARKELLDLVQFDRVNLLDNNLRLNGPFDAIFCRNVMIYFDKPTQRGILTKFQPLMREDGLLFAGHSESFMHSADMFRSLGRTVYALAGQKK